MKSIRNSIRIWKPLLLLLVVTGYFSLTQHYLFHQLNNSRPRKSDVDITHHADNTHKSGQSDSINESCFHCIVSHNFAADLAVKILVFANFRSFTYLQYLSESYHFQSIVLYKSRAPPYLI